MCVCTSVSVSVNVRIRVSSFLQFVGNTMRFVAAATVNSAGFVCIFRSAPAKHGNVIEAHVSVAVWRLIFEARLWTRVGGTFVVSAQVWAGECVDVFVAVSAYYLYRVDREF